MLVSNWDLHSGAEMSRAGETVHNLPECAQVEGRGRSLQSQSNDMEEEEEQGDEEEYSNQLRSSSTPTFPLRRVTCHTYSLHQPRQVSSWSEQQVDTMEVSRSNPLYQTSMETGSKQEGGAYANLLRRPSPVGLPDDTYEQIPVENIQGNTYESLEAVKTRKSKSTRGKNVSRREDAVPLDRHWRRSRAYKLVPFLLCLQNTKWKKFFPNHKKN